MVFKVEEGLNLQEINVIIDALQGVSESLSKDISIESDLHDTLVDIYEGHVVRDEEHLHSYLDYEMNKETRLKILESNLDSLLEEWDKVKNARPAGILNKAIKKWSDKKDAVLESIKEVKEEIEKLK